MTDEQRTLATQLRTEGLSQTKIAKQLGLSQSRIWNFFNPKPKPTPPKPKTKPPPLPHSPPSSVPMRRVINHEVRQQPQLTHEQMYADLAIAVRNTARLRV